MGHTLKCQEKLNHLLFMDDLKNYGKSEHEINTLVSTVELFSTDVGMEFGTKKCGTLILKKGKAVRYDGLELQLKKEDINTFELQSFIESQNTLPGCAKATKPIEFKKLK